MQNAQRLGFITVLISAAGFAFLPTITRGLYQVSDLEALDIGLWRFILATPLIWVLLQFWRPARLSHRTQAQRIKLLLSGVLFAGAAMTSFIGLKYITASIFIVLFFTYPAMVVLLSVLLGRRLALNAWIALGLTLLGVFLTVPDFSQLSADATLGVVFALLNAFIVAVYFLVVERLMKDAAVFGTAYVITGALLTLLVLLPFEGLQMPSNSQTWIYLLLLATLCTVVPIFMMNYGIQLIGPERASIISSAEPIMAMIVALIVLGEVILPAQWLGAVCIVAGVFVLQFTPGRSNRVQVVEPLS
ncbi:DMT family transporter [Phototrophicus methaneseepsis]|uniref:DMT family transporter n=1 Tax=Phototrophicus methaneseepsis TaxID=2710758 RepID=A0A7S8EDC8_9CHLR|nr:DMT family transporter [Phototrophicus methaneseepsis]QPC84769.1 DMT family transporter [Phototrophicus methaneseepsis]